MTKNLNSNKRLIDIEWRRYPQVYFWVALAALVFQAVPSWRPFLIYDRGAVGHGELWRMWTGHLVHFGWPHFVTDTGLFVILGWTLGIKHPQFSWLAFVLMPVFISAALYWFDPGMGRYAGLSALNFGLLVYMATQGWQRDWTDWFWPAVLVLYVGEVVYEIYRGGHGGGMIEFDDSSVQVATSAHIAGGIYAVISSGVARLRQRFAVSRRE